MTAAGTRPLAGRRIVVTRRPEQSAWLTGRLRELGATVVELPLIEVVPPADTTALDAALRALAGYDWVVFSSANAVRSVSARMSSLGIADRDLIARKVASVGPSTTEALRECFAGVAVAVEPADHDAESLAGELVGRASRRRFLFPTSDRGRAALPKGLRAAGATVDVVVAYRTVAPAGLEERVRQCLGEGADLVTFASPSAVENLAAAAGGLLPGIRAAVIGPVTGEACRKAGIAVKVLAEPSTAEGLAAAIERHFEG